MSSSDPDPDRPRDAAAVGRRPRGVRVRVRLTPRGGRDEVAGETLLADGRRALAVRVRAAPERGAANAALEKLLARVLGVASGAARVVSGHKDRVKIVEVAGDAGALVDRARRILEARAR